MPEDKARAEAQAKLDKQTADWKTFQTEFALFGDRVSEAHHYGRDQVRQYSNGLNLGAELPHPGVKHGHLTNEGLEALFTQREEEINKRKGSVRDLLVRAVDEGRINTADRDGAFEALGLEPLKKVWEASVKELTLVSTEEVTAKSVEESLSAALKGVFGDGMDVTVKVKVREVTR